VRVEDLPVTTRFAIRLVGSPGSQQPLAPGLDDGGAAVRDSEFADRGRGGEHR
jgi:hypothetical protein